MLYQLIVLRGPLVGRVFPLGDLALWFGRTPEAPVPLASELSSRRHAELRKEDGVFILRDLGSVNGTLVNGARITVRPLAPGDIVEIGSDAFRFASTHADGGAALGRIIVIRGPLAGRDFRLDAPITFGRGLECTVVIQSQRASRYHAQTHLEPRGVVLSDHKSGNGTWVNGARIEAHVLCDGDIITIGDEEFKVELSTPAVDAPQTETAEPPGRPAWVPPGGVTVPRAPAPSAGLASGPRAPTSPGPPSPFEGTSPGGPPVAAGPYPASAPQTPPQPTAPPAPMLGVR